MKYVVAVLLAVTSGQVNATSASVVNPKIFVIKPKITVVQDMLDLVNRAFISSEFINGTAVRETAKFSDIVSITDKIYSRTEQLISIPKLLRLNGDELVNYKMTMEKEAIHQLREERSISYGEIATHLRSMYEQGIEGYNEELLEMINQLER